MAKKIAKIPRITLRCSIDEYRRWKELTRDMSNSGIASAVITRYLIESVSEQKSVGYQKIIKHVGRTE